MKAEEGAPPRPARAREAPAGATGGRPRARLPAHVAAGTGGVSSGRECWFLIPVLRVCAPPRPSRYAGPLTLSLSRGERGRRREGRGGVVYGARIQRPGIRGCLVGGVPSPPLSPRGRETQRAGGNGADRPARIDGQHGPLPAERDLRPVQAHSPARGEGDASRTKQPLTGTCSTQVHHAGPSWLRRRCAVSRRGAAPAPLPGGAASGGAASGAPCPCDLHEPARGLLVGLAPRPGTAPPA